MRLTGGTPGSREPDELLFERVYALNFARVASYLLARADPDSAADAVGRTFEIAWRRLHDVPAVPLPWLLGVARRVLAEQRRAQGRHDALVERIAQTGQQSSADHVDALVVRSQLLGRSKGSRSRRERRCC